MEQTRASVTALGSALMRAVHTRLDRPRLIEDSWGDRLVLELERQAVARLILRGLDSATRTQIETLDSVALLDAALRAHLGYGWAIIRTRYTEDSLEAAVARGVRQYVILGAGFDSLALRQPVFAREVAIFAGADYARGTAVQLGLEGCFRAFLPKPHIMFDDQAPAEWRRFIHVHPGEAAARTPEDYATALALGAG
jgi:hypothetical protein